MAHRHGWLLLDYMRCMSCPHAQVVSLLLLTGEEDGVQYHFTNHQAMSSDVSNGLFLEHADVHGNMYGTSLRAVADVGSTGKMCVLDIDVQGAEQVCEHAFVVVNCLIE